MVLVAAFRVEKERCTRFHLTRKSERCGGVHIGWFRRLEGRLKAGFHKQKSIPVNKWAGARTNDGCINEQVSEVVLQRGRTLHPWCSIERLLHSPPAAYSSPRPRCVQD